MPTRIWAVMALGLATFLSGLDASIANVALPTIAHRLNISAVDAIWIVNSYQLALVSCLLAFSALGEIIGYRALSLGGIALFAVASLGCMLAPNWGTLIAARVLQGIGAAGVVGVANALLRYIFPQRMIGRGFGIYALLASSGAALGPIIASAILSVLDWPWLFGVSVPPALLALVAGLRTLPASEVIVRRFDFTGAILTAACLVLLLLGVDGLAHHATIVVAIAELAGTAALGFGLVAWETRLAEPLLPLDLLRIPVFGLSVIVSLGLYSTQFLAFVSLPFYFRDVLGLSQTDTGLLMTPWPLILTVTAPVSGWLSDRYSPGILCGCGMLLTSAGMALLVILPAHPSVSDILWRVVVCGLGWGLVVAPNSRAMLVAAPRRRAGAASGMTATSRILGQTLGTGMTALIFGLFTQNPTILCLLLGIVLGVGAALLSFRRHSATRADAAT